MFRDNDKSETPKLIEGDVRLITRSFSLSADQESVNVLGL